ncbi:hemerythrin domain-containing protein [Streptomyces spirodelae]|uniref:Hemerythrin domain-containing protein n=1 Tax=Streptomyces spirodelae TaxID=2812904 RepID=A0ABS3WR51_9ACTN|nr:hemerythrin domain-containing protein [Streptomyces spirodelae]MBO8185591.1 hemerythrin domain-containing protein [Streptomyces spirodelae]
MAHHPDLLELLTDERAETERLVAAYEAARDPERRAALAAELAAGLERHALAEGHALYPAVRRVLPDGDRLVAAARRRWEDTAATVRELRAAEPDSATARHRMSALLDQVREHAAREQDEVFAPLRERLGRRELRALGAEAARRLTDG